MRGNFAAHAFAGSGAPVQRVPFEQQRAAYASAAHLPLSSPARQGSGNTSAVGGAYHTDGAPAAHATGDAWTRFGENRSTDTSVHGTSSAPSYAGAARGTGNVPTYSRGTGNVPTYSRGTGNAPSYARGSTGTGAAGFPNGGYGYHPSGSGAARSYSAPARSYGSARTTHPAPSRGTTSHAPRSSSHPADHHPG